MLKSRPSAPLYHRGHPLSQRGDAEAEGPPRKKQKGRAVVNAGLWLGTPDADAFFHLAVSVRTTGLKEGFGKRIACAPGTWAPFNSQNTALLREVIPAYFLFPRVGRYDDIWASFVVRKISDHLGDRVTYGVPLVRQERNRHVLTEDLKAEWLGMTCSDPFLEALRSCRLTRRDYAGAFGEIARQFLRRIGTACRKIGKDPRLFRDVCEGFRQWAGLFR